MCVSVFPFCAFVCVCVTKNDHFLELHQKKFDMCFKMFQKLFACEWRNVITFSRRSVGAPREWRKMINFSRRSVGVVHHIDVIHHHDVVHFLVVVHHHGDLPHQDVVQMRRNPFGLIITLPCSSPLSLQPWVFNHGMMELLHLVGYMSSLWCIRPPLARRH